MENHCIKASICMGDTGEDLKNSITDILNNASKYEFVFTNEGIQNIVHTSLRIMQIIESGFPVILFAKVKSFSVKIKLESTPDATYIFLYPLESVKKKRGIDCDQEDLDLGFYVERMLELCEEFVIFKLSTSEECDYITKH